jgi:hypothetical protein
MARICSTNLWHIYLNSCLKIQPDSPFFGRLANPSLKENTKRTCTWRSPSWRQFIKTSGTAHSAAGVHLFWTLCLVLRIQHAMWHFRNKLEEVNEEGNDLKREGYISEDIKKKSMRKRKWATKNTGWDKKRVRKVSGRKVRKYIGTKRGRK